MASRLLKILEKIEDDRLEAIEIANRNGFNFDKKNTSFEDLMDALEQLDPDSEHFDLGVEAWVPEIDTISILRNAEDRDGLHPGFIMLIYADKVSTIFYPFNKSTIVESGKNMETVTPGSFSHGSAIGANAILTSDGAWYDVTNIEQPVEHVWDITKDIDSERYNKVRWFIGYVDDNPRTHINFPYYEAIDYVLGDMKIGGGNYVSFDVMNSGYTAFTQQDYARNLERIYFLPESNGGNVFTLSVVNSGSNFPNSFHGHKKLQTVIFNNVERIAGASLHNNWFAASYTPYPGASSLEWYPVTTLELPDLKYLTGYPYIFFSGEEFRLPKIIQIPSYSYPFNLYGYLRKIYINPDFRSSGSYGLFGVYGSTVYVTENNYVYNTISIGRLVKHARAMSFGNNSLTLASVSHFYNRLERIDILGTNLISNGYKWYIGDCPRLREIFFQPNTLDIALFDVSSLNLLEDSVYSILDALASSNFNGVLKLGKNMRYLSAGDIEEAEAKGWTVEE